MYVATSQRVIIFPMVANYKSLCLPADHPREGGKEGMKGKRKIFSEFYVKEFLLVSLIIRVISTNDIFDNGITKRVS